mgnify:CR=1
MYPEIGESTNKWWEVIDNFIVDCGKLNIRVYFDSREVSIKEFLILLTNRLKKDYWEDLPVIKEDE